jgi:hypothetical protein
VSSEVRVNLIFDPFGIFSAGGAHIRNAQEEKAAFRDIEELLTRDSRFETVRPKTYVIEGRCWEHFRTYREIDGVRIDEVKPRRKLNERLHADAPPWLTDEVIFNLKLWDEVGPTALIGDDWVVTIATWLFPGIDEVSSLREWLRVVSLGSKWPKELNDTPVAEWLADNFEKWAQPSIQSAENVLELRTSLRNADSPITFASEWTERTALLPLTRPDIDKPLVALGLPPESPRHIVLAGRLPLVFPLREGAHEKVSRIMRLSVQRARIERPTSFENVVMRLNALWDGVAEELSIWLDVAPKSMTSRTAAHLRSLPGFEINETVQRFVTNFVPPDPVPVWSGLEDNFDSWVSAYGSFIARCYFRRDLPTGEADPATHFGRWVKDNPSVFFDHPDRSYRYVARKIQEVLKSRRPVIVIVIDALAVHLSPQAVAYLSDSLGSHPVLTHFVFAPLPTITEVCKEALLTGRVPSECHGNLAQALNSAFSLEDGQLQLVADWHDADRVQVNKHTRLLVYRDNRLDDRLTTAKSYRLLTDECPTIFSRIARLAKRWVDDMALLHDVRPCVILTADHGFTFGPPPGAETKSHRTLDGSHRCVLVGDGISQAEAQDDDLTYIDRSTFHLKNSYLAARGRYFGTGTVSGWSLAHGGLLPEEVIVPFVEWFGDEVSVPWPEVQFPEGALIDGTNCILHVALLNQNPMPTPAGTIRLTVSGQHKSATIAIPALQPGQRHEETISLAGGPIGDSQTIPIDLDLNVRIGDQSYDRPRQVDVPRIMQLVERTEEQSQFEKMFE